MSVTAAYEALERHRDEAADAMITLLEWCDAAGREYLYRWHLAANMLAVPAYGHCFGAPHLIGQ